MDDHRDDKTKQKFDLLYASLCEIQKTLLDSTAKVAGFLLLATGWIATSGAAREFLQADARSRYFAVIALGGAFLFFALAATKAHLASKGMVDLLTQLDYLPREYYLARQVDLPTLVLFVVGNFFLASLAIGLILRTTAPPPLPG